MALAITVVQLYCAARKNEPLIECLTGSEFKPITHDADCEPGMREREFGIELKRFEEHLARLWFVFVSHTIVELDAAIKAIVCSQCSRMLSPRPFGTCIFQPARQCSHDGACHLVLDDEEIAHIAFVALGPELTGGIGFGKPSGNANLLTGPQHRAVDDILDRELAPSLSGIDKVFPESGMTRDN